MRTKIAMFAVATVAVLTGCSAQGEPQEPSDLASLRVLTQECEADTVEECGRVLSIDAEGKWTLDDQSGNLPQVSFIQVKEAVRDTTLASAPDTQADCPLQYGGVESIYTWTTGEKTHQIHSCETEASSADPLVMVLQNLWVDLDALDEEL